MQAQVVLHGVCEAAIELGGPVVRHSLGTHFIYDVVAFVVLKSMLGLQLLPLRRIHVMREGANEFVLNPKPAFFKWIGGSPWLRELLPWHQWRRVSKNSNFFPGGGPPL